MDKENLEYERCGGPLYHWPVALPGRSLCFGRKSGLARIGQLHRALPVTGLLGKANFLIGPRRRAGSAAGHTTSEKSLKRYPGNAP